MDERGDEINQRLSVWQIGVDRVGCRSALDQSSRPAVRECREVEIREITRTGGFIHKYVEKNKEDRKMLQAQKHRLKHHKPAPTTIPACNDPPHLYITHSHICDNATAA